MRLLRSFVSLNLAMVAVNGGGYTYQLLASRGLSVAGYSHWTTFFAFYVIAYVPGYTLTLVAARRVAELAARDRREARRYVGTVSRQAGAVLLGALALSLVACLAAAAVSRTLPLLVLTLVAIVTFSNLALALPLGIVQGLHEFGQYSFILVLNSVLNLVLSGLLLLAGGGLAGMLCGLALSNAAAIAAGAALVHRSLREGKRDNLPTATTVPAQRMSENYAVVIATYAFLTLLLYTDTLLAQQLLGVQVAGRYDVVAVAARVVFYAPYAVPTMIVPWVAARNAAGRDPRPLLLAGLTFTAAIVLPVVGGYTMAPGLLLRVLFGSGYASSAGVRLLPRYAVAIAPLTLTYLLVHYFMACRRLVHLGALAAGLLALAVSLAIGHARPEELIRAVLLGNGVSALLLLGLAAAISARSPRTQPALAAVAVPTRPTAAGEKP